MSGEVEGAEADGVLPRFDSGGPCPVCGEVGGFHDAGPHRGHQVPAELILDKGWLAAAVEERKAAARYLETGGREPTRQERLADQAALEAAREVTCAGSPVKLRGDRITDEMRRTEEEVSAVFGDEPLFVDPCPICAGWEGELDASIKDAHLCRKHRFFVERLDGFLEENRELLARLAEHEAKEVRGDG